jgi:predicted ArsR family transcriptional regulator
MSYPDTPGFKALGPSSEAAQKMTRHAATVRGRVLQFLRSEHPASFTPDQIAHRLGISFLSVRPRVSELHLQGEIEPDGTRRKNDSGMSAQCWRASKRSDGASS